MSLSVETRTSVYSLREDGIIEQRVKENVTQSLPDAVENVSAGVQLAAGKKRPLLVDMRASFKTDDGVLEYYSGPEGTRAVSRMALVVGSLSSRIIGNFFLRISRPRVPCQVFNDLSKALTWLGA